MPPPRLRMQGVEKRFGATHALRDVTFEVGPGEVHALIGENGAGKSTLMKVLSGACLPDSGVMELNGEPLIPRSPLHARACGIGMIYQELTLAPHLTVEENILLGAEPARLGFARRREGRRLAAQALGNLGQPGIPLDAPVYTRPIAEQQMVEIARALLGSPRILIMDEPTSSLTQYDSEKLFLAIEQLRLSGVSIIYISHFLEECRRVASRFTVLRDGRTVGTGLISETSASAIIRLMVGREIEDIYPRTAHAIGKTVFQARELRGKSKPRAASFDLREGEILGVAGLVGSGRTEMLRAAFGLDPMVSGTIEILHRNCGDEGPAERLREGIGFVSENRKEEGLMLIRSIADNLTLTHLKPFSFLGWIRGAKQNEAASKWMKQLDVRARNPDQPISELSGGNQQKIAIARLLHHRAKILLLDEPTRGVDVGSKVQIYQLIAELAEQGKAVIFVSSYIPELLGICDSIAVMSRGVLSAARPVSDWTEHSIIEAAVGREECSLAS